MVLSEQERKAKPEELAESEDLDVDEMLEAAAFDSVSPGICVAEGCSYTTSVEPDQREGHCEACGGQTVQSALVLAELI